MQDNGVHASVTTEAVRASLARCYEVPVSSVFLQERHVAKAFQEALFAEFAGTERASTLTRLLGVECARTR